MPATRPPTSPSSGAGYTGLWTAYYLLQRDPTLRIVILEAEQAGFGASGRNGGWASALFPASLPALARQSTRDAAIRLKREMFATVDEIGRVASAEGWDIEWSKGGTVVAARTPLQLASAREEIDELRTWGFGPDDYALLDRAETERRVGATDVLGGTYTPHCAAVHPARLVRSLARSVVRAGAVLHEGTRVEAIEPGIVRTAHGHRARRVRRARHRGLHAHTEGPDARARPRLLAHAGHRAAARRGVGPDRPR